MLIVKLRKGENALVFARGCENIKLLVYLNLLLNELSKLQMLRYRRLLLIHQHNNALFLYIQNIFPQKELPDIF